MSSSALFHDSLQNKGCQGAPGRPAAGCVGWRQITLQAAGSLLLLRPPQNPRTCVEATDQVFAGASARAAALEKLQAVRGACQVSALLSPAAIQTGKGKRALPTQRRPSGRRALPLLLLSRSPAAEACLNTLAGLRPASTRSLLCDCVPPPAAAPSRPCRHSSAARLKPCVTGHSHPGGERGPR